MEKAPRYRTLFLFALLVAILVLSVFVSLKLDFDNRDRLFQNVTRDSPEAMQALQKLSEITPPDAVIFSWWDYGRAVQDFGARRAVVAYPSRDIFQSVGASNNPIYALEVQLFGTYESSEKIRDLARAFLLPEDGSLEIMKRYGATHVMVFDGEGELGAFSDLEKFYWIAKIAGYNASEYVRVNPASPRPTYELTSKAEQVTMLRLLFDERFRPQHFVKLYENSVAKIYRVEYSASQSTGSAEQVLVVPIIALTALTTVVRHPVN